MHGRLNQSRAITLVEPRDQRSGHARESPLEDVDLSGPLAEPGVLIGGDGARARVRGSDLSIGVEVQLRRRRRGVLGTRPASI